jgi:hypothetical protein
MTGFYNKMKILVAICYSNCTLHQQVSPMTKLINVKIRKHYCVELGITNFFLKTKTFSCASLEIQNSPIPDSTLRMLAYKRLQTRKKQPSSSKQQEK